MVSTPQKRVRAAADAALDAGIVIAPLRPTREKALALQRGEYRSLSDEELNGRTADLLARKAHNNADLYRASGFRYELARTRKAGGPSIICVELEDRLGPHPRMEAKWDAAWQSTEARADLWARITASRAEARPSGGGHYLVSVAADSLEKRRIPRVHRVEAGSQAEMFAEVLTGAVIAAPSYDVHPSGETYELTQNVAWDDLTYLSETDYSLLAEVFAELDEAPEKENGCEGSMSTFTSLGSRARAARDQYDAEHFDDPTRAIELLASAGWDIQEGADAGIRISRPGADGRTSGIIGGLDGFGGCVKVFTTSVPELPEGFYTPFALLAYLGHDGDGAHFAGEPNAAADWLDRTGQVDVTPRSMAAAHRPLIDTGRLTTHDAVEALMQAVREARDPALGADVPMVVMQTSAKGEAEHPVILRPHGQRVAVTNRQAWVALALAVAQPARIKEN